MAEPRDGVCCSCGYAGEEETECAAREDRTHCVHWWEGDTRPDEDLIEILPGGDLFVHAEGCEGGCDYDCGVLVCGRCGAEWSGTPVEHCVAHYNAHGRLKHYCTREACPNFTESSMRASPDVETGETRPVRGDAPAVTSKEGRDGR